MVNTQCKNAMQESQIHGIKYVSLTFANRLLTINQTLYASEKLINTLIESNIRLTKMCNIERIERC